MKYSSVGKKENRWLTSDLSLKQNSQHLTRILFVTRSIVAFLEKTCRHAQRKRRWVLIEVYTTGRVNS